MKNFRESGDTVTIVNRAGFTILAGMAVLQGTLKGFAVNSAADGEEYNLQTRGVATVPVTFTGNRQAGAPVYWDPDTNRLHDTVGILFGAILDDNPGAGVREVDVRVG